MPVYTNDIGRRNERIADADREMSKVFDDVTDDVARSFHLDSFARLTASISERIDRAANCVIVLPIALYCFFVLPFVFHVSYRLLVQIHNIMLFSLRRPVFFVSF